MIVSPGAFFGPSGEGYVRFALVPTLEECERARGDQTRGYCDAREERSRPSTAARSASPSRSTASGGSNEEAKEAILHYFRLRTMVPMEAGPFKYRDKVPPKRDYPDRRPGRAARDVARYGSYVSPGAVLMPSYVNIGAWVGPNTMVDTWATVGSCAQIGADVHLSGGVGIGGVLEPFPRAAGDRRGRRLPRLARDRHRGRADRREAVLGADVVITALDADYRRHRARGGEDPRRRAATGGRRARHVEPVA